MEPSGLVSEQSLFKQLEHQYQHHKVFLLLFFIFVFGSLVGHLFFPVEPFHPIVDKRFRGPKDRAFIQHQMLKILREYASKEYSVQKLDKVTTREFQKFVKNNQPLVLTRVSQKWKAMMSWNDDYLKSKIGTIQVSIEVSKPTKGSGGTHNVLMTMNDFMEKYDNPQRKSNYYLSQGHMKNFPNLDSDYPLNLDFAPRYWKSLGKLFLMGAGGQSTPIHNDNYEQIVCQLKGTRTILLYNPNQADLLYLDEFMPSHSKVDPINPDLQVYPLFANAQSLKVTLKEGEVLYIPFGWFHTESSREGKNMAISYLYSPDSDIQSLYLTSLTSPFWKDPFDDKAKKVMNRKTKWKLKRKNSIIE